MTNEKIINAQYGQSDLGTKILTALQSSGKDPEALTREDLASFEEIHIRGRVATIELAQAAQLTEGLHVLDVGCGIGGPARTLAAEFGCYVTGLDLNQEYCRTAELLNGLVGLSDRISIHQGNALSMPFVDRTFDLVWIQHTMMNIVDKNTLLDQIYRVLRPNGRIALHEVCSGAISPPYFPVVWADTPTLNFLLSPKALFQLISMNRFKESLWTDITAKSLQWYQDMRSNRASRAKRLFGLDLVIGPDFAKKGANIRRNLEENRIVVVQGIFHKNNIVSVSEA